MIFIAAAALLLFSLVVMLLWNALVPEIFNGPVLSFGQAVGLLLLAKIIFGFGRGWGGHRHPGHWKKKIHQKMSSMTEEERKAFKEKLGAKFKMHCDDGD